MAKKYIAHVYAGKRYIKDAIDRVRRKTPSGWGIVYQGRVYPFKDSKIDIYDQSFEKEVCPPEGSQASKNYRVGKIIFPGDDVINNSPKIPDLFSEKLSVENKFLHKTSDFLFGYNDVKQLVREHLKYYLEDEIKQLIKLPCPDGIILYGPPGCGKTFFAKWIASMLGFELVELPKSKFGSIYVDGAMNELSKILNELKSKSKQVIFFDEFDSVAVNRNNPNSHNESDKVVNTLLQEIPKLTENENLVIAATNYLNKLDNAIIRSGRFGLKIPVFPPNSFERETILRNLIYNSFQDNNKLRPYLENLSLSDSKFWPNLSNDLFLFSNSDLKLLSYKISMSLAEEYSKGKKININDLLKLKDTFTIRCQDHIDFYKEIEGNFSEMIRDRYENYKSELISKGCIKLEKKDGMGFKIRKND